MVSTLNNLALHRCATLPYVDPYRSLGSCWTHFEELAKVSILTNRDDASSILLSFLTDRDDESSILLTVPDGKGANQPRRLTKRQRTAGLARTPKRAAERN